MVFRDKAIKNTELGAFYAAGVTGRFLFSVV